MQLLLEVLHIRSLSFNAQKDADDFFYLRDLRISYYSVKKEETKKPIDLSELSKESIEYLYSIADSRILKNLDRFKKLQDSKSNEDRVIKKPSDITTILKASLKDSKYKYLFKKDSENNYLPYLIKSITNKPKTSHDTAHVAVLLTYNKHGNTHTKTIKIDKEDLPTTLSDILEDKKYFLPTDNIIKKYLKQLNKYEKVKSKFNTLFNVNGYGYIETKSGYNTYQQILRLSEHQVILENEDENLIVRDSNLNKFSVTAFSTERTALIPLHPYVQTYSINKHLQISVHINNLFNYNFNKDLIDLLVLPKEEKELISVLLEDVKNTKEGAFILSTGVAGVGKTLTAQCFAQILEKPLYEVQCSQIGINVEEVENNLEEILQRAKKYNCILLIDEADVYIRKRGTDIVQNAIVGVFLRLIEKYTGILFMTSNLENQIDDAIASRATVHFKYKLPTEKQKLKIAKGIVKQKGYKVEKGVCKFIAGYKDFSGRDIKELLRLSNKYPSEKITVEIIKKAVKYSK